METFEFTAQIAPNAENLVDAVYDAVSKMNIHYKLLEKRKHILIW